MRHENFYNDQLLHAFSFGAVLTFPFLYIDFDN